MKMIVDSIKIIFRKNKNKLMSSKYHNEIMIYTTTN